MHVAGEVQEVGQKVSGFYVFFFFILFAFPILILVKISQLDAILGTMAFSPASPCLSFNF